MVVISQAREETSPLLPTSRKGSRSVAGALAVVALFAVAALVAVSVNQPRRVVLSGDGVVPADQLSFTQGEKVHFAGAKKLGDVAARVGIAGYFDQLGAQMNKEHKEAEKESDKEARSALSGYFDSLGHKYHQLAEKEKEERSMVHPGKLDRTRSTKNQEEMAEDEEIVVSKIQEGKAEEVERKEAAPKKQKVSWAEPLRAKKQASLAIADKVKVNFYMESMCPGCKYFTTHVLSSLLQDNDFNKMVDFKLVPYGNGQLTGGTVSGCKDSPGGCQVACQHGDPECKGNQILACLQHYHPITEADAGFVPTFVCMEGKDGLPKDEFADCAGSNGLDQAAQDAILQCADSGEGHELAVLAGVDTESLDPPHEYAPWVTLNGKPLRDDAYELQEQVCGAFKGSAPASMCSSSELKTVQQSLHNIAFSLCPKELGVV